MEEDRYTLAEAHLAFAKRTNGRVWELLEKPDRSRRDEEELVHSAHASLYHWLEAGTGVHHQRGAWLIARVYTVLGNAAEALHHARRCLELTEEHRALLQDFDLAFAFEGMARASALAHQPQEASMYRKKAQEAGRAIQDEEDRAIFFKDFDGGEWFGVV